MAKLKDIAREAGVSVMSVSRAINGDTTKVSEETAKRIMSIVKRTGYIPNSSARSLSSKKSHIVSIIIHGEGDYLLDPYLSLILGRIIKNLEHNDYHVMINLVNDYHDVTRSLRTWNVAGAIFLGTFDKDIKFIQEDNKIPLVFIDSYSPIRQITNIGIDDYKGGALAAMHFIERGHKNLAFVGTTLDFNNSGVVDFRLQGYKNTIANAGLILKQEHIIEADENSGIMDSILESKEAVTAIFASSDMLAINLIDEMHTMGLRIPEDYSIIGFDDLPLSHYITPKLTTISQDIEKKAQHACRILFERISDHNIPSQNIVMDVQLIERNSVRKIT